MHRAKTGKQNGKGYMAKYVLISKWGFDAPIDTVWDAIYDIEGWPLWWPSVERVTAVSSAPVRQFEAYTIIWKTRLPYKMTFDTQITRVETASLLEATVVGDAHGLGRCDLNADGGLTVVKYTWDIETKKWWMNLTAPLARPVFEWNHNEVMRAGAKGLASWLNTTLVEID